MGAELAPAGGGPGGAEAMDQMAGLAPRYQAMAQKMGPEFAMQRAQDFAAGKLPSQQGQAPVMKPSFPMGPNPAGGGLNPRAGGGRMNPGMPGAQPGGASPPIFGGHVMDAMKGNGRDPALGGMAFGGQDMIQNVQRGGGPPGWVTQAGQQVGGGPMMSKPLPFDPAAQGMQHAFDGPQPIPGGQPGMQIKPLQQGLANARGVLSGGIRQAVSGGGGAAPKVGGRFNNGQGNNPRAR